MLDDRDIQKIVEANREVFATKEDLERFATKEDLERFATKEDLERFATKEDLEEFQDELRGELYLVRDELRGNIRDLNEKFNQVIDSLDRLTKSMEILSHEYVALGAKTDRHEKWIQQLAKKLGVGLEY